MQEKFKLSELVWIFDLDGTLFESHHQIIEVVNHTRLALLHEPLPFEEAFKKIGLPASSFFEGLGMSSHQVDEAVVAFRSKLALVLKDGTPLYPGAEALLKKLKHLGFDIGIATMKPNDLAEQMIKISPIKDLITAVQGSTGIEPKPNPEVLNRIKQKVDCRPLIMVGDRFEDLDCAKNANSPSIGIGQTVVSKLDLELRGAFAAYDNLLDMHEDLEQLLLRVSLKFKRP